LAAISLLKDEEAGAFTRLETRACMEALKDKSNFGTL
jgi:hypothetical protein